MRRGSACDNVRLHINGERAGFLVQLGDEMLIRQVAAEWSVSHRWIRSLAALAEHFPPETRCPDKSVLTHSAWRNKDLAQ